MTSSFETPFAALWLAESVTAYLSSPYRPFLMFLPFIPWAWLVSSKLDKDSRYFHLNTGMWNALHLSAGVLALAAMLFVPIFWIGWPVGMLLLATPVLVYWQYRNRQVPEAQRFSLSDVSVGDRMAARRQKRAATEAVIQFIDAAGEARPVPLKDDPTFAVHMQTEDIVGPAVDARASAVEIAVGKSNATVAQLIDGIRYKSSLGPEAALAVVDYLKDMAGLDVKDRRRHQSGAARMRGPQGQSELSITTAGSSSGLVLRADFDRRKRLSKPFDSLGLLPSQIESLKSLTETHDRHGIVLVGAPPGHGLSTTCYSLVARHDAYTSNIKTLERDVQLRIDGVDHVQWDPSNPDIDYNTQLQSMLRRDPDLLLVDLVKDVETAKTIIEPGMQGPLIYIPQRAPTVVDQIRDWVKVVGDVKRACRPLRAVLNQRLVRTLCPNCRQPYQPTAEQVKKLGLPAGKVTQLFRPSGKIQVKSKIEDCPVCGGKGYLGQTGIFEVMAVTDEIRSLLCKSDLKGALALARRNKMIYLQEAGLSKVAAGETTIDEIVRVTTTQKASAPPPRSKSADPAPA